MNFVLMVGENYLCKAIALYRSLMDLNVSFNLFFIAFDATTFEVLSTANYKNIIPIKLESIETAELKKIKAERSLKEYYFTCTPFIVKYAIEMFSLDHCIYLDADLYFYRNPVVLIDEMKPNSILITEHRYSPQYDNSLKSGRYCVQFMPFVNDEKGMKALNWWKDRCFEWCFHRFEDGKFSDQGYLNDWPTRFESVHVLRHLGGGVAPWNVQKYKFRDKNSFIFQENSTGNHFPLVFYHFQGLRFYDFGLIDIGTYDLNKEIVEALYSPYVHKLRMIEKELLDLLPRKNYLGVQNIPSNLRERIRFLRRFLKTEIKWIN